MSGRYYSSSRDNSGFLAAIFSFGWLLFLLAAILGACVADPLLGVGGYGPVNKYSVTVVSKHIDAQKDSSSYMVNTNNGTFEVDNGMLLDVWNADEIYGSILVDHEYCFTAKGNRVTNFWMQQYPYILKVEKGGCDGA